MKKSPFDEHCTDYEYDKNDFMENYNILINANNT